MRAADANEILRLADSDRSACSAGAAAISAAFARSIGRHGAEVVEYGTSYEVRPDSSFVGYVGVAYS